MRAGELRERVTIQAPNMSQNSYGEETVNWSDVATVWARVEFLGGQENYRRAVDQAVSTATYRIIMRYRSDVTEEHRIQWRGRYLGILSVHPNYAGGFTLCMCEVVT